MTSPLRIIESAVYTPAVARTDGNDNVIGDVTYVGLSCGHVCSRTRARPRPLARATPRGGEAV